METNETKINSIADAVIEQLVNTKGETIVNYQLNNPIVSDNLIVVTAKNNIHIRALKDVVEKWFSDNRESNLTDEFYEIPRLSGDHQCGWIVMDLNVIVIHIVLDELRSHYQLDEIFEKQGTAFHN